MSAVTQLKPTIVTKDEAIAELQAARQHMAYLTHRLARVEDISIKWLSEGTTDLQCGFMALEKALLNPKGF